MTFAVTRNNQEHILDLSLKRRSPKRMIVVAPTGVAAINAGGVTIHSFFQLPFGPYVPGRTEENRSGEKRFNHKFGREKINIIRSMDLLPHR